MRHLGLFLYEYLGEEYPEVLGRELRLAMVGGLDVFAPNKALVYGSHHLTVIDGPSLHGKMVMNCIQYTSVHCSYWGLFLHDERCTLSEYSKLGAWTDAGHTSGLGNVLKGS